jgi:hypothetical protein
MVLKYKIGILLILVSCITLSCFKFDNPTVAVISGQLLNFADSTPITNTTLFMEKSYASGWSTMSTIKTAFTTDSIGHFSLQFDFTANHEPGYYDASIFWLNGTIGANIKMKETDTSIGTIYLKKN